MRAKQQRGVRCRGPDGAEVIAHRQLQPALRQMMLDAADLAYQSSADPKKRLAKYTELLARDVDLSAPVVWAMPDPVDSLQTTLGMMMIDDTKRAPPMIVPLEGLLAMGPAPAATFAADSAEHQLPSEDGSSTTEAPYVSRIHPDKMVKVPTEVGLELCGPGYLLIWLMFGHKELSIFDNPQKPIRTYIQDHLLMLERGEASVLGRRMPALQFASSERAWLLKTAEDTERYDGDAQGQYFIDCLLKRWKTTDNGQV